MVFNVTDATTGKAIPGARIRAGDLAAVSDQNGQATLALGGNASNVTVQRDGYQPVYGSVGKDLSTRQTVALRPVTVAVNQSRPNTDGQRANAGVGADSPASAAAPRSADAAQRDTTALAATVSTAEPAADASAANAVSGVVTDQSGQPIAGALVSVGDVTAKTRKDGSFRLKNAPAQGELVVAASGYADQRVSLAADRKAAIKLERQAIKAIYLSGANAGSPDKVKRLVQLVDQTEINAVVVDVKEDYVFYKTQVGFFRDSGAVRSTYDAQQLVKMLHEHHIYVIARLVVFNDPIVAQNRPDLAVKDSRGGVWHGANGGAWVNPFNQELWKANVDLAVEAAQLGFDEIQYDYIRFPSDGDLRTADFGPNYNEEGRVGAIVDFLRMSKNALRPSGVKLAVDVFGIITIYGDDQGIGQRLADIAPFVDYLCPMDYPSHFDPTSIDVGGQPNDHPYETVALSLALAKKKIPGLELKLRPWLQDFSLKGMKPYGAADVRAQIQAAEDGGASGWMIWNPSNDYTNGAFAPAS